MAAPLYFGAKTALALYRLYKIYKKKGHLEKLAQFTKHKDQRKALRVLEGVEKKYGLKPKDMGGDFVARFLYQYRPGVKSGKQLDEILGLVKRQRKRNVPGKRNPLYERLIKEADLEAGKLSGYNLSKVELRSILKGLRSAKPGGKGSRAVGPRRGPHPMKVAIDKIQATFDKLSKELGPDAAAERMNIAFGLKKDPKQVLQMFDPMRLPKSTAGTPRIKKKGLRNIKDILDHRFPQKPPRTGTRHDVKPFKLIPEGQRASGFGGSGRGVVRGGGGGSGSRPSGGAVGTVVNRFGIKQTARQHTPRGTSFKFGTKITSRPRYKGRIKDPLYDEYSTPRSTAGSGNIKPPREMPKFVKGMKAAIKKDPKRGRIRRTSSWMWRNKGKTALYTGLLTGGWQTAKHMTGQSLDEYGYPHPETPTLDKKVPLPKESDSQYHQELLDGYLEAARNGFTGTPQDYEDLIKYNELRNRERQDQYK